MSLIPNNLKYTKSHEWIRVEEDGSITIGITEHAQDLLGDLVFVELPETHVDVSAEEEIAVVESVKAASDVYAPISGEITAVNELLFNNPELVNQDPYGEGWLIRIQPDDADDLKKLLDSDGYQKQINAEAH
ncbi:MAG: glycine cleavage system protein GcvH [Gammaproteobacteria bacterium]